jgi:hypothetical protein
MSNILDQQKKAELRGDIVSSYKRIGHIFNNQQLEKWGKEELEEMSKLLLAAEEFYEKTKKPVPEKTWKKRDQEF